MRLTFAILYDFVDEGTELVAGEIAGTFRGITSNPARVKIEAGGVHLVEISEITTPAEDVLSPEALGLVERMCSYSGLEIDQRFISGQLIRISIDGAGDSNAPGTTTAVYQGVYRRDEDEPLVEIYGDPGTIPTASVMWPLDRFEARHDLGEGYLEEHGPRDRREYRLVDRPVSSGDQVEMRLRDGSFLQLTIATPPEAQLRFAGDGLADDVDLVIPDSAILRWPL